MADVGTAAPGRPAERSSAGSSSAERILIADQDADRPRWAPDGKRFAFLSTKEGGSQVWIAEFDGAAGTVTAAHKLTSIATEAGGELWSPDGKNILFTSDVYPECDGEPAAETDCNAKKLKEAEAVEGQSADLRPSALSPLECLQGRQAQSHLRRFRPRLPTSGDMSDSRRNIELVQTPPRDLTPGDYDAPVFSLGGQDDYAFSPDGQEICYASNHDKNPAASTNNDLWIVPVSGRRQAQEHHRRQSRQRHVAALFPRWPLHRLPRPAASGIRERPLPPDALRPQDGREEESDGESRPLGRERLRGRRTRSASISCTNQRAKPPSGFVRDRSGPSSQTVTVDGDPEGDCRRTNDFRRVQRRWLRIRR